MRLTVKGKNVEVTEQIRSYAEQKLAKLGRQLNDLTLVELELAVETNPSIADSHVAEVTVFTKGPVIRARGASADMRASIDQLTDKLERQVVRYREKRQGTNGRGVVREKQFPVAEMSADEAAEHMELLGHDFFLFRNEQSDEVNVVYRRREGGYGVIAPEAS
jgi:putative sigma-54 modulation protein